MLRLARARAEDMVMIVGVASGRDVSRRAHAGGVACVACAPRRCEYRISILVRGGDVSAGSEQGESKARSEYKKKKQRARNSKTMQGENPVVICGTKKGKDWSPELFVSRQRRCKNEDAKKRRRPNFCRKGQNGGRGPVPGRLKWEARVCVRTYRLSGITT